MTEFSEGIKKVQIKMRMGTEWEHIVVKIIENRMDKLNVVVADLNKKIIKGQLVEL